MTIEFLVGCSSDVKERVSGVKCNVSSGVVATKNGNAGFATKDIACLGSYRTRYIPGAKQQLQISCRLKTAANLSGQSTKGTASFALEDYVMNQQANALHRLPLNIEGQTIGQCVSLALCFTTVPQVNWQKLTAKFAYDVKQERDYSDDSQYKHSEHEDSEYEESEYEANDFDDLEDKQDFGQPNPGAAAFNTIATAATTAIGNSNASPSVTVLDPVKKKSRRKLNKLESMYGSTTVLPAKTSNSIYRGRRRGSAEALALIRNVAGRIHQRPQTARPSSLILHTRPAKPLNNPQETLAATKAQYDWNPLRCPPTLGRGHSYNSVGRCRRCAIREEDVLEKLAKFTSMESS
eukprot:CAMPEP_0175121762 /NCGR_PEP_ID=MMETSP0087-20121206/1343_1 /TAXON_ID=136419 /ORGANISM="Unknown Unknown, Strain D1" /LENGTH=349 /DNA_ID=CAMNT_0016403329 /DNA_START=476 /DNA_END=1525 /DNA_ORIENTATION=+